MGYKLEKPYTERQRCDFIVEHNHNNSLKIIEEANCIYALEEDEILQNGEIIKDPEYQEKKQKTLAKQEYEKIQEEINELDLKRIRAICENEIKDETTNQTWLEFYNGKIKSLRQKMQNLLI